MLGESNYRLSPISLEALVAPVGGGKFGFPTRRLADSPTAERMVRPIIPPLILHRSRRLRYASSTPDVEIIIITIPHESLVEQSVNG